MIREEPGMERYNCSRIRREVTIHTVTVHIYRGGSSVPSTSQKTAKRCSGSSICNLFPPGDFPLPELFSVATGCPYIDSLRTTGR